MDFLSETPPIGMLRKHNVPAVKLGGGQEWPPPRPSAVSPPLPFLPWVWVQLPGSWIVPRSLVCRAVCWRHVGKSTESP